MLVLITYDVSTSTEGGTRRLRQVAKACLDYGQRVQNSVFECNVDASQFVFLQKRLLKLIDARHDSLRFYHLGVEWKRKVEHYGVNPSVDIDGPLIL